MKVKNALNVGHVLLFVQHVTVSFYLQVVEAILANIGIGIHVFIMDLLE